MFTLLRLRLGFGSGPCLETQASTDVNLRGIVKQWLNVCQWLLAQRRINEGNVHIIAVLQLFS